MSTPTTPQTARFGAIYQALPRETFAAMLLLTAQTPQNHLNDEEDCGREPSPDYVDGARYTAAAQIADMLRWRFALDDTATPNPIDIVGALDLSVFMYDDARSPLVERLLASYENPLEVLDRAVQGLFTAVRAIDEALDRKEEPPTGDTYNELHQTVVFGLGELQGTILRLKKEGR